ncbi:hypothetical protein KW796_02040 [Candidatus Parcubacteria bacterium]|nr:hypothetical protein [Candidatus Parcubacteria bacterium]
MDKNKKDINMESKRTEKLVSAIYLLTSFFDEKEPMKWRLRELGGRMISLRDNRNTVLEIVSLLTVAKNAGLISDTNHEIIHREFSQLVTGNPTLSDFLKADEREIYKAISAEKPEKLEQKEPQKPSFYISSSVRETGIIKDKTPRDHREAPKDGVVAVKKNSRQNVILSVLRKKKEIMIKDVSPLIEGVSEKTIQRELLAMVSSGILKKEGEKRWSRYSLAE